VSGSVSGVVPGVVSVGSPTVESGAPDHTLRLADAVLGAVLSAITAIASTDHVAALRIVAADLGVVRLDPRVSVAVRVPCRFADERRTAVDVA